MTRPYTGAKDGIAKRKRPGTEHFAALVQYLSGGKLWNNGTLAIRNARGKSTLSIHATGRAVDLSFRRTARFPGATRTTVLIWLDFLVKNADELGVELIVDYSYQKGLGGGRTWRCDRGTWQNAKPGAIAGGGQAWADWIHVELCPFAADSVEWVQGVFEKLLAEIPAE